MVTEIKDQIFGGDELSEIVMPANGGRYIFENCTFNNVSLKFESEQIIFNNCDFEGVAAIHNQGSGDIDSVELIRCQSREDLNTLKISSADIFMGGVNLAAGDVELSASSMMIDKSVIEASLGITYYEELTVKNSELSKLLKLVCLQGEEATFLAQAATINGTTLSEGLIPVNSIFEQRQLR